MNCAVTSANKFSGQSGIRSVDYTDISSLTWRYCQQAVYLPYTSQPSFCDYSVYDNHH